MRDFYSYLSKLGASLLNYSCNLISKEKLILLLVEAKLGILQSPPPKCFFSSSNCKGAAKSPLFLLWPFHPIVSSVASKFLQKSHLPMAPPKCASWPLVNKPNGSHHEEMEVCCGNILADPWPPQDRSDDNHGDFHAPWNTPISMLSSK